MTYEWLMGPAGALGWVLLSTLGMYIAILVFARSAGVRSFAEMSAFDIAITIAIGSVIATTIVAKTPSLLEGTLAALGLYTCQLLVSRARSRARAVERAVDNRPILLMAHGGRILHENLRVARITEDDLRRALRKANVIDHRQVQAVIMEGTGGINVLHGHGGPIADQSWILHNVRDYSGRG